MHKPSEITHYDILGVERDASLTDIRKAYKNLAIENHPDKHPGEEVLYLEKIKRLTAANGILSDPILKATYDRTLPSISSEVLESQTSLNLICNNAPKLDISNELKALMIELGSSSIKKRIARAFTRTNRKQALDAFTTALNKSIKIKLHSDKMISLLGDEKCNAYFINLSKLTTRDKISALIQLNNDILKESGDALKQLAQAILPTTLDITDTIDFHTCFDNVVKFQNFYNGLQSSLRNNNPYRKDAAFQTEIRTVITENEEINAIIETKITNILTSMKHFEEDYLRMEIERIQPFVYELLPESTLQIPQNLAQLNDWVANAQNELKGPLKLKILSNLNLLTISEKFRVDTLETNELMKLAIKVDRRYILKDIRSICGENIGYKNYLKTQTDLLDNNSDLLTLSDSLKFISSKQRELSAIFDHTKPRVISTTDLSRSPNLEALIRIAADNTRKILLNEINSVPAQTFSELGKYLDRLRTTSLSEKSVIRLREMSADIQKKKPFIANIVLKLEHVTSNEKKNFSFDSKCSFDSIQSLSNTLNEREQTKKKRIKEYAKSAKESTNALHEENPKSNHYSDEQRITLIAKLEQYIERIELNQIVGKPNFKHGFYMFKTTQGLNRNVNYRIAQELIKKLQEPATNIKELFKNQNIQDIKKGIITTEFKQIPSFWDVGMNSTMLNSIIRDAQGIKPDTTHKTPIDTTLIKEETRSSTTPRPGRGYNDDGID